MRKGITALINSDYNMTKGNHRVEHHGDIIKYYYFKTAVCVVDTRREVFYLDDGGWGGHSSTTRTLNQYRSEYSHYTEVTKEEFEAVEAV